MRSISCPAPLAVCLHPLVAKESSRQVSKRQVPVRFSFIGFIIFSQTEVREVRKGGSGFSKSHNSAKGCESDAREQEPHRFIARAPGEKARNLGTERFRCAHTEGDDENSTNDQNDSQVFVHKTSPRKDRAAVNFPEWRPLFGRLGPIRPDPVRNCCNLQCSETKPCVLPCSGKCSLQCHPSIRHGSRADCWLASRLHIPLHSGTAPYFQHLDAY